ncbi:hypothetical protein GZL_03950 [Streptomyces sp. 769]|nr:hypothetical protein GZL_03950 [Streptomyces sp. 769]
MDGWKEESAEGRSAVRCRGGPGFRPVRRAVGGAAGAVRRRPVR